MSIVVLKGEMSRDLYWLVGNVQTGGATGRVTISDSSEWQVVRRKRETFTSSTKCGDDLCGLR